jgi:hypothetical protein
LVNLPKRKSPGLATPANRVASTASVVGEQLRRGPPAVRGGAIGAALATNRLLKNAVVAFFNLAKRRAKLAAARKSSVFQTLDLASLPCDAADRFFQRAATPGRGR